MATSSLQETKKCASPGWVNQCDSRKDGKSLENEDGMAQDEWMILDNWIGLVLLEVNMD